MSNKHPGHRSRLKEKFIENGLDSMNDINALELLLFYAIPRADTNPLAHDLLDRFGSLDGVFKAPREELMEVEGIGENAALLLNLVPAIYKKRMVSKIPNNMHLLSKKDAESYFIPRFMDERDEVMLVAFLDSQSRVICCKELARGVVNAADVCSRRIAEYALKYKASSIMLAHNHPDGPLVPSREDDLFTKNLNKALGLIGISITDHIIVADGQAVSFREKGLFNFYI